MYYKIILVSGKLAADGPSTTADEDDDDNCDDNGNCGDENKETPANVENLSSENATNWFFVQKT